MASEWRSAFLMQICLAEEAYPERNPVLESSIVPDLRDGKDRCEVVPRRPAPHAFVEI